MAALRKAAIYRGDIWNLISSTLIPKASYGMFLGLYNQTQTDRIQTALLEREDSDKDTYEYTGS